MGKKNHKTGVRPKTAKTAGVYVKKSSHPQTRYKYIAQWETVVIYDIKDAGKSMLRPIKGFFGHILGCNLNHKQVEKWKNKLVKSQQY